MSFNSFQRRPTSRAVWSRHDGGHGWWGWGRRDTRDFGETDLKTAKEKKKNPNKVRWPPVTWSNFPLLSPLITENAGKGWKGGRGGDEQMKGFFLGWGGWSHNTTRMCVKCNKVGREPQGVSPHSHVAANPTDALHLWEGWHVCIHVVYFILHAVWQQGLLITHWACQNSFIFLTVAAASTELMKGLIQRERRHYCGQSTVQLEDVITMQKNSPITEYSSIL